MNTKQFSANHAVQSGGFIRQHQSMLIGIHQLTDVLLIWGLLAVLVNVADASWEICYQAAAFVSSLCYHVCAHKTGHRGSLSG